MSDTALLMEDFTSLWGLFTLVWSSNWHNICVSRPFPLHGWIRSLHLFCDLYLLIHKPQHFVAFLLYWSQQRGIYIWPCPTGWRSWSDGRLLLTLWNPYQEGLSCWRSTKYTSKTVPPHHCSTGSISPGYRWMQTSRNNFLLSLLGSVPLQGEVGGIPIPRYVRLAYAVYPRIQTSRKNSKRETIMAVLI